MEDTLSLIALKCSDIKRLQFKRRAIANLIAYCAVKEHINNFGYAVESAAVLQNSPTIRKHLDYAELYVNNFRIVTRYVLDDNLCIPLKLRKYNLLGDYIAFVCIKDTVQVLGFLPSEMVPEGNDGKYISVQRENLLSFENIKDSLLKSQSDDVIDELNSYRKDIVSYLNGNLDDKITFFKMLSKSACLRRQLIELDLADYIAKKLISSEDEIINSVRDENANISHLADMFIQSPSSFDWKEKMS